MQEKKSTKITFMLEYRIRRGEEIVFVNLQSSPKLGKNIKWSFLGNPQYYTFDEFRKILSQIRHKRGDSLKFYIINEEAGKKEGIGIFQENGL